MAIIRRLKTQIHVFTTEDDMNAAADGDLTRLYIIKGGVFIDHNTYNEKYEIELFEDASGELHGLFVRI